ncbi:sulfite exporter TauE/SafE family protein [Gulosibacter macacae]|uniref:Probable membrane transporter protein n=2 Tax=Gulosibacter macacae TaxID=2488791 RepID=A0A3P3VTM7_9MICO|nr:sulfite exporter TauE/SafE family protein [Gulosibacter macacae]
MIAVNFAPAATTVGPATALPANWFPEGMSLGLLALVLLAGFMAGFVDAVVGGGGLIQLPALLLIPGLSPVQALATNKLGSIFGTATSAATYIRRVRPDLRTALPMAAVALIGSMLGASVATYLPKQVFMPIIIVVLLGVATFTALKPNLGLEHELRYTGRRHTLTALVLGFGLGAYDGLLGPGTGSFLVIGLVTMLGYDFLQASAKARLVNFATNLGALMIFIPHGAVIWGLGLALGAANMLGGYLGARLAIDRGARFVRLAFLIVSAALIVKLSWDTFIARSS